MSNRQQVSSPPIAPIYSQAKPNAPIELGHVRLQFDCKGSSYQEEAKVEMRFVPRHALEFTCPLEGKSPLLGVQLFLHDDADKQEFSLIDRGVTFEGHCSAAGGTRGGIVFVPNKSAVMVTRPSNAISVANIHLFNFPDFSGPGDYILTSGTPPMQGHKRCGLVVLKADGWTITISRPQIKPAIFRRHSKPTAATS